MSSIQVIDRSASLIDAIAAAEHPLSLKVLSADTGLHPSTAFRILGADVHVRRNDEIDLAGAEALELPPAAVREAVAAHPVVAHQLVDLVLVGQLADRGDAFLPARHYIDQYGFTVNEDGTVPHTP